MMLLRIERIIMIKLMDQQLEPTINMLEEDTMHKPMFNLFICLFVVLIFLLNTAILV